MFPIVQLHPFCTLQVSIFLKEQERSKRKTKRQQLFESFQKKKTLHPKKVSSGPPARNNGETPTFRFQKKKACQVANDDDSRLASFHGLALWNDTSPSRATYWKGIGIFLGIPDIGSSECLEFLFHVILQNVRKKNFHENTFKYTHALFK